MSNQNYISSSKALWYWLIILFAAVAVMAIFFIPEDDVPLVYLRSGLSVIFILFLPGFAFMKILFPTKVPFKTSSESMDSLERVALSFGISIILTPMVAFVLDKIGVLLDPAQLGVRLIPITLSLLALSVVLATAALVRELKQDKSKQNGVVVVE